MEFAQHPASPQLVLDSLNQWRTQHSPAQAGYLVACSGGRDSMVLAHALYEMGAPMALAHVNFGLRGAEALADETWVHCWGRARRLRVHRLCVRTAALAERWGCSPQVAARRVRYQWFQHLHRVYGYPWVLTAHHREDLAETLLLSLLRGRNPGVWQGIPPERGIFARPLLETPGQALQAYAQAHALTWREDASNQSNRYLRNRIRQQVLPALQAVHPDPATALVERWRQARRQTVVLRNRARHLLRQLLQPAPDGVSLLLKPWNELERPEAVWWLDYWLHQACGLPQQQRSAVLDLMQAPAGAALQTASGLWRRTPDTLTLDAAPHYTPPPVRVAQSGQGRWGPWRYHLRQARRLPGRATLLRAAKHGIFYFRAQGPFVLRQGHPQDLFHPLGAAYARPLAAWLKKNPPGYWRRKYLLAAAEGEELIWVAPNRLSQAARLPLGTEEPLTNLESNWRLQVFWAPKAIPMYFRL